MCCCIYCLVNRKKHRKILRIQISEIIFNLESFLKGTYLYYYIKYQEIFFSIVSLDIDMNNKYKLYISQK